MWLMKTGNCLTKPEDLELVNFPGDDVPPYAILSHTWGEDEVLFADVINNYGRSKKGFSKVLHAKEQAFMDGHEYIWLDNCCIDKSSSAELSESINSMYTWYIRAEVCYVHLSDVSQDQFADQFDLAKWWTRGWTLQELLAPQNLLFYSKDWTYLGTKLTLACSITQITSIDIGYLDGSSPIEAASVSRRMSWASMRQTSRGEDIAYCLMGLFGVNMPMLYGEGEKRAFVRLQEEIMKSSDDHSIFAWTDPTIQDSDTRHGLLADHSRAFHSCGEIHPPEDFARSPFSMTNLGLSIQLPIIMDTPGIYAAALSCPTVGVPAGSIGIFLVRLGSKAPQYARIRCNRLASIWTADGPPQDIFVRQMMPLGVGGPVPLTEWIQMPSMDGLLRKGYRVKDVISPVTEDTGSDRSRHLSYSPADPTHLPTGSRRILVRFVAEPESVSVALSIECIGSGQTFVVMIGSKSTGPGIGFDAMISDEIPTTDELQASYRPRALGQIVTVGCQEISILVDEHVRVSRKYYMIVLTVRRTRSPRNSGQPTAPRIFQRMKHRYLDWSRTVDAIT